MLRDEPGYSLPQL